MSEAKLTAVSVCQAAAKLIVVVVSFTPLLGEKKSNNIKKKKERKKELSVFTGFEKKLMKKNFLFPHKQVRQPPCRRVFRESFLSVGGGGKYRSAPLNSRFSPVLECERR